MKPLPESITTALAAFYTGGAVAKDAEMRPDDLAEIRTALAVPLCHASIPRFACLCLLPTGHRGEHSGDAPPGVRALRIAMAEVDRLTARVAELEARARDVARIAFVDPETGLAAPAPPGCGCSLFVMRGRPLVPARVVLADRLGRRL